MKNLFTPTKAAMKQLIFGTTRSWTPILLRLFLGFIFFAHGSQKALGWFGGYGFEGTMGYFTGVVGLPWMIGFFVIVIEFIGGLCIFFGLATRLWSFLLIVLVIGIVSTVHWQYGLFMNWEGNQKGEGIEFFLLVIAASLSLMVTGAGKLSIDASLSKKQSMTREAREQWLPA